MTDDQHARRGVTIDNPRGHDGHPTRRRVLGSVGTAGVLLTLGTGAASAQGARSQQGGSGLVREDLWEDRADDLFRIVERSDTFVIRCRGQPRRWRCYIIEFEDGVRTWLFVNPQRRLDLDEADERHEFTAAGGLECLHDHEDETVTREYVQVSFKPAT